MLSSISSSDFFKENRKGNRPEWVDNEDTTRCLHTVVNFYHPFVGWLDLHQHVTYLNGITAQA